VVLEWKFRSIRNAAGQPGKTILAVFLGSEIKFSTCFYRSAGVGGAEAPPRLLLSGLQPKSTPRPLTTLTIASFRVGENGLIVWLLIGSFRKVGSQGFSSQEVMTWVTAGNLKKSESRTAPEA
jgi:hypothetical protein